MEPEKTKIYHTYNKKHWNLVQLEAEQYFSIPRNKSKLVQLETEVNISTTCNNWNLVKQRNNDPYLWERYCVGMIC